MYPLADESLQRHYFQHPFWQAAFRPGFLMAALWSIITQFIWLYRLTGQPLFINHSIISPWAWYMHEFLFGFIGTVAVSFLLTISEQGQKVRKMSGPILVVFFGLWLVSRIAFLVPMKGGIEVAAVTTLLWWSIGIFMFWRAVERSGNHSQRVFVPILICLMLLDLGMFAMIIQRMEHLTSVCSGAGVLTIGLMISVAAGWLMPKLTAQRIDDYEDMSPEWLSPLLFLLSVGSIALYILNNFWSLGITVAPLILAAGVVHLIRQLFWLREEVLSDPLLWSLHLGNAMLGIGLVLMGLSFFIPALHMNLALHVIALGSAGAMIMSMMSRVTLVYTGRSQQVSWLMSLAFSLTFFSALARLLLTLLNQPFAAWTVSGVSWIIAYGLFLVCFLPALLSSRVDEEGQLEMA
ncbi:Uncharacterised protein [BD1-7 clade bacterium]|uniref:NnrS protein n=1 Tax=BD1-7 clade bacterium TaxID=2029982 RepID=A0A5S9QXW1_9GAMM|nr:Uncharacterised protein [BD1-7 clade bacterium]